MVGGFRSEPWATSNQNAGRLQIGIGGRITSEPAPSGARRFFPCLSIVLPGIAKAKAQAQPMRLARALIVDEYP